MSRDEDVIRIAEWSNLMESVNQISIEYKIVYGLNQAVFRT